MGERVEGRRAFGPRGAFPARQCIRVHVSNDIIAAVAGLLQRHYNAISTTPPWPPLATHFLHISHFSTLHYPFFFAERHDAPAVHVPRPGSAARLGASWHPSGSGPRLPPLPPHGPHAARPAADALTHARRARASPRAAQRGCGAARRRPTALLVQDVQAGGHQSQAPPDPGKNIRFKAPSWYSVIEGLIRSLRAQRLLNICITRIICYKIYFILIKY